MIQESIPGLLKNGIPVTESDTAMNTTLENKAKKKETTNKGYLRNNKCAMITGMVWPSVMEIQNQWMSSHKSSSKMIDDHHPL